MIPKDNETSESQVPTEINGSSNTEEEISQPEPSETPKQILEPSPTTELLKKQKFLIQPSIKDFTKIIKKPEPVQEEEKIEEEEEESEEETDDEDDPEEDEINLENDKKRILTVIRSSLTEEKKEQQKNVENAEEATVDKNTEISEDEDDNDDDVKTIVANKNNETKENVREDLDIKLVKNDNQSKETDDVKEATENSKPIIEESTPKIIIKMGTNKMPSINRYPKTDMIRTRHFEKSKEKTIDSGIIPVKASINKEFRSYSNMKNRNKVPPSNHEAIKPKSDNEAKDVVETQKEPRAMTLQKRKMSADEITLGPSSKLVKLVPIESILGKNLKPKNVKVTPPEEGTSVKIKSPINSTPPSSVVSGSVSTEEMLVTIKSEPESDDDFQETENLEAKKRYDFFSYW